MVIRLGREGNIGLYDLAAVDKDLGGGFIYPHMYSIAILFGQRRLDQRFGKVAAKVRKATLASIHDESLLIGIKGKNDFLSLAVLQGKIKYRKAIRLDGKAQYIAVVIIIGSYREGLFGELVHNDRSAILFITYFFDREAGHDHM